MKTLLFAGLVALPLSVGSAWAAERLSDAQMDRVSAGALPMCDAGPGCNFSSSSTTTNTTPQSPNGVLVTKTTNTFTCTADTCSNQVINVAIAGTTGATGSATTGNPVPFPPPPVQPPVSITNPLPPITIPAL